MNELERKVALRSFLMECRARIKPEDVGLPSLGRRRVPGLRREEVAQLAGVSASWYTLFETAPEIRVSPRMLHNVARALQLSRDETIYLFSLAIDEMPTIARTDLSSTGAVGVEYAELMTFAKRARAASSLDELEQMVVELVFRLSSPAETAFFVEADLERREFSFAAQMTARHVEPVTADPVPFSAVHDAENVLVRGEIFAENRLMESSHRIMGERARTIGTGRYISAGIKAGDFTGAIGYAQKSTEPHSDREKSLLGLIAELVTLALSSRR